MNLNTLVFAAFMLSMIPGLLVWGLVSLVHPDAGLYLGILVWGFVFSFRLGRFVAFPRDRIRVTEVSDLNK